MARTSWAELKAEALGAMTAAERREYDQGYAEAKLAAEVEERVRRGQIRNRSRRNEGGPHPAR